MKLRFLLTVALAVLFGCHQPKIETSSSDDLTRHEGYRQWNRQNSGLQVYECVIPEIQQKHELARIQLLGSDWDVWVWYPWDQYHSGGGIHLVEHEISEPALRIKVEYLVRKYGQDCMEPPK